MTGWRIGAIIVSLALVLAYAGLSGAWVATGSSWYLSLARPPWQPPDPVFGLAWAYNFTALAVVGIALSLRLSPAPLVTYLVLFGVSVIAACAWAWLFYVQRDLTWSAVALTCAALLTVGLVVVAFREAAWTGIVLLPYQVWLVIATSLSWGYRALNP